MVKYISFPSGSVVKNLPASTGAMRDTGLIPESGRPSGGGNGNPLQYSCLGNPLDRGTWWATAHRVAESDLSEHACPYKIYKHKLYHLNYFKYKFQLEGIGYPPQYSWASLVAQLVKNLPAVQETWVQSLGWEDLLKKGKATHFSILAWRIPWTRVHGVTKNRTRLRDLQFHFHL